jgi:hypothetical protein
MSDISKDLEKVETAARAIRKEAQQGSKEGTGQERVKESPQEMIARLKARISKLEATRDELQRQLSSSKKRPQVSLAFEDGCLELKSQISAEDPISKKIRTYDTSQKVEVGKFFEGIAPLVRSAVLLGQAIERGQYIEDHFEKGQKDLKTGKVQTIKVDGKPLMIPNQMDRLKAMCIVLGTSKAGQEISEKIGTVLRDQEKLVSQIANSLANNKDYTSLLSMERS